jgi:hypothetical protein
MGELIGPMLKIKDKAAALEVERLLQMVQQKIGPDQIDLQTTAVALMRQIEAQHVPFFWNFINGVEGSEATDIDVHGHFAVRTLPTADAFTTMNVTNEATGSGSRGIYVSTYAGSSGYDMYGSSGTWYVRPTGEAKLGNTSVEAFDAKGLRTIATYDTIASGAITVDSAQCLVEIETEGGAASDDLNTINGGANGQILILMGNGSVHVVNVTNAGNIDLGASPRVLSSQHDYVVLFYYATIWHEFLYSNV